MTDDRTEVSPAARAAFDLAFLTGDLEGMREYGDVLRTTTEIDAYEYAMAEIADTAKYVTLLHLRYERTAVEAARLKTENARLRAEVERLGGPSCSD